MRDYKKTELKNIEKYKLKVLQQFPKAFLSTVGKRYTIVQEQPDLTVKDILSELCIHPQETVLKAWEMAAMSAKTTQNFNRTHPYRIEVYDSEDKIARIEGRKNRRVKEEKSSYKPTELDSYYIFD